MRYIFWFWFLPMGFLWSWYLLSYHDISFGLSFFSRQMHDLVFAIYGQLLGIEKPVIVKLLIKACIVDTFLIMGIFAFRKRRQLAAWWQARRAAKRDQAVAADVESAPVQVPSPAE